MVVALVKLLFMRCLHKYCFLLCYILLTVFNVEYFPSHENCDLIGKLYARLNITHAPVTISGICYE